MECNRTSDEEIKELYSHYLKNPSISTDSRNIKQGDIFFALKGENFDGNEFVFKALELGASLVVCDNEEIIQRNNLLNERNNLLNQRKKIFFCRNSLTTLQNLAKYHREQLSTTIIGITGTNGKTTTKELIHCVLSKKFKTLATKGNLNNHIGVPLTLLSIPQDTEIAIVEMGANHLGEIGFLCEIAQPDMGIVTNIGTAHIEGFGSVENIVKTKKALYEYVKTQSQKYSHIFVNIDDEFLKNETYDKKTTYSLKNQANIIAKATTQNAYAQITYQNQTITSSLIGIYNAYNILAALTIGEYLKVEFELIKQAIEEYTPSNNRSQVLKTENNTLILDCYNANPSSCKAAIESFANTEAKNKIVFMGAMKELGEVSKQEHQNISELIQSKNFDRVVLIGEEYKDVASKGIEWFATSEELKTYLIENKISSSTILIKGSRSTKMEVLKDVL
ncbi:MAG: UDP-N-acetylmuramoyl-tripeptide--D-alanyl-D-alanine ligase [Bacteroidales bacterium]|nr:UDP-N-acetylmuramoyl-tripeptide--D-alanyl-D-alanine ligase [Bacteroidales bacterium]